MQCRRQGHGGGIRTAAPQGGDIAMWIDSLKARDDHNLAGIQCSPDLMVVNMLNARPGMGRISHDGDLPAGERNGGLTDTLQRHAQQRNGHLLAGAEQGVQFAFRRGIGQGARQLQETVGFTRHGGDDHHYLMTGAMTGRDPFRDGPDAFHAANGGAAKLLYDECHFQ